MQGTQADRVFETVRAGILACRMEPGRKIHIAALAGECGVSLGAAREALSRLIPAGLVRNEPQKGFTVAPVSRRDLLDLTAARIALETMCLRTAIEAGDVEWETQAVAAFHRLGRIPPGRPGEPGALNPDWAAAHAKFHRALVEACGNAVLLRVRDALYDESERYRNWCLPVSLAGSGRAVAAEHAAIMAAVLARDADASCALMRDHLQRTADILLASPLIAET